MKILRKINNDFLKVLYLYMVRIIKNIGVFDVNPKEHNKIKNTGILFELLTRQIAIDVMNDKKDWFYQNH